MRVQPRFLLPALLLLSLLGACSKEEFAGSPSSDSFTANPVAVFQNQTCSNHTLVKPPVDILYVVDNSRSSTFLAPTVKEQIRQTIQAVSQEFDYHILVAPLLPTSSVGENSFPLLTNVPSNVTYNNIVSPEGLNVSNFFSGSTGSTFENGFDRTIQVIGNYRSGAKPVFRQNAHTIVILVSNGDDNTVIFQQGGQRRFDNTIFGQKLANFQNLRTSLQAQQFRFFSVVAHTAACVSGYDEGYAYKLMSQSLYQQSGATDQSVNDNTPDSYNLCTNEYTQMYTGVNNSIRQEVLDHRYNFWPITNSTDTNIDTGNIQVFKVLANGSTVTIPESPVNGFQLVPGGVQTRNTRYAPTPGEPATGILMSLNGTAEVVYPECIVVRTSTPIEEYQYVVLPTAPIQTTIIIRVRGQQISEGAPNGWTYEGFRTNQDIKVPGTSNVPTLKSGYFIRLNGTSKYVSGDTVESFYAPAPI